MLTDHLPTKIKTLEQVRDRLAAEGFCGRVLNDQAQKNVTTGNVIATYLDDAIREAKVELRKETEKAKAPKRRPSRIRIAACIAAAIAVACLWSSNAGAQSYDPESGTCYRTAAYRDMWFDTIVYRRVPTACAQYREHHYHHRPSYDRYEHRERTRVYGYTRRHEEPESRGRGHCLAPRSVIGLEKYNVEEAKENAISMWMEAERLHNGVKWMDPQNAIVMSADGKGPECFISSTGNRLSEKAANQANQVLHQCEFRARPCAGGIADDDDRRGRKR